MIVIYAVKGNRFEVRAGASLRDYTNRITGKVGRGVSARQYALSEAHALAAKLGITSEPVKIEAKRVF